MKTILRSVIASLVLLPAIAFAAKFEGKVTFKVNAGKETFDMVQSVKDNMMRQDMNMAKGSGASIVDMKNMKTIVIMDQMKMYMSIDMNKAAEKAGKEEDVKIEKTSDTEKILGYTATKYLVSAKEGVTELWLTEALGGYIAPASNPMGGKSSAPAAWARVFAGKELFPLRIVTKGKNGKETYRMEATAIEKQKLPDTLFAIPEGYSEFSMGNMMKGMIPGFGR